MLSINDAFRKFKSRLELNEKEQKNAIKRHKEVREYMATKFSSDRDFLTGSYTRNTKTKPLKDIDIFFVFGESENHYRKKDPSVILDDIYDALVDKYGHSAVRPQGRSVGINFGIVVDAEDNTDYRIVSVDVVPAFEKEDYYEIPDVENGEWIKTNPEIHAKEAIDAHQAFSKEWKGLVRMIKYWNNNEKHGEKAVKPSFLIEVMALECLYGDFQGQFDREVQSLFSTLAGRIYDDWPDPAGFGPNVSDGMDDARKKRAHQLLQEASQQSSIAINHVRQGRNAEALRTWREIFGPKFPLS